MAGYSFAGPSNQTWSADWHFIQDLTTLKRWYMDANANEDLYKMTKALKLVLALSKPKLKKYKPEEVSKRIQWIEDNLYMIEHQDKDGKSTETDGTRYNKRVITTYVEDTFDMVLDKLQVAGVYTKNSMDKRDAGGDFSGA